MRLAIVVPRYGPEIVGGAETFARQMAEHLLPAGFAVEVLTTCTDNVGLGKNVFPAGSTAINGVRVHRFPIDPRFRDERRFHELTAKFIHHLPMTVDEEYEWIDMNAHSPALYHHLIRHGEGFDFLLFVPYLYGITFYGTTLWPGRSILWPCMHDEPFAYLLATRLMINACRGIMFNSEPERRLVHEKLGIQHPRSCVVGGGIEAGPADPQRFRSRWSLAEPFLLYAGRIELTKNVLELVTFFIEYKQHRPGPLKLVLMGEGLLDIPTHPDVISIGFQNEHDKHDVYAAATLLVQPSLLESFSIVIMESWLAGVPVLVHDQCEVTRYHVLRSNGGLCYAGFAEFAATLDWMLERPAARARMGALGRAYVRQEHNWDAVLDRFRAALAIWQRAG
ncbi:MAG: glycosyltransferase family 4 protein [Anaerolineae bacterium]|nr:glycosyltransferase family 4 protein [Anaerolineae bacterium]